MIATLKAKDRVKVIASLYDLASISIPDEQGKVLQGAASVEVVDPFEVLSLSVVIRDPRPNVNVFWRVPSHFVVPVPPASEEAR